MSETVSFTEMKNGSKADYELLERLENDYCRTLPERLLEALSKLEYTLSGYQVSRLQHSLQSATRADAAGESDEIIVAALLHDIGDELAPQSHSEMAAAILRPYVSPKTYWLIKYHGVFQMYYYAHHLNGDRNARDRFRDHEWYADSVRFCEEYDQNCFDPNYSAQPLEFFEPLLRKIFARTPWENHAA